MSTGKTRTVSALSLSVLGATCCALPAALVALGAGGAVASMASSAPWLIWLSQYKAWTFAGTAAVLIYAEWQTRRVEACDVADAARLRRQTWILRGAAVLLAISVFVSYALLPLMQVVQE